MAFPTTPEWIIPCNNNTARISRNLPLLSLLSFNSSRDLNLSARSSSCSAPVLEHQASSTPNNSQPTIELDLQLQDLCPSPLPEPEDFNALICTLLKDPHTAGIGHEYYEKAKGNPGFIPQRSTLNLLVRYFMSSRNWGSISLLLQDFRAFHVLPDGSTCCRLISSCVRARKFKIVNSLLESLIDYDKRAAVLGFDSAMKGFNTLHMYSTTVVLYRRMKSAGLVLEPGSYCSTMEAFLKMGKHEKVVSLFREFEGRRVESTQFHAQIYKCLCKSLEKLGRPFEALEYFREMTRKGIPEDRSFYSSLICAFATAREVKLAEELLEEAEGKGMVRDPALFLKLVLMYIEEGMLERTFDVISVMNRVKIRVSDCISCAIVNAFSRKRGPRVAATVYEKLVSQGCEPGQVTYASILNIYCRIGVYSKAEMTFSEMEQKGFDKCIVAYSSMVNMYGKTGRHKEATRLVAKMKERGCEPNVWIYNTLLDIHGRASNMKQVEKVWKEMKRRKVVPDRVSYTSVISAYSKAKELESCVKYYQDFKLNGGKTDRAMAGIMVGVFSKMNKVDELVKLLQDLKTDETKLDERLYRSALNALRDAGLEIRAKWLQESFAVAT
ncbi:PREDICTED: pentatricopeptide repeat-containing protein At5g13770, chloroplastic isoform X2 [Ipomoea nil]|uniref:pentatricopeptide repeat-containing protein At5g13770, chloroplastic isoform X2 n=1 Tax=Ipomoea nil TaxID=35883 RepID=UPI000900F85F|nr:PREDICTED: pentatricopeptide repeat-containing protein At5g13770, chloroplastic isoform X2 [Ipomoea nil]